MKTGRLAPLGYLAALLLTGCYVQQINPGPRLDRRARWVLLPVQNHGETPQAGERMEAILATLLRARGVTDLRSYPAAQPQSALPELDDQRRYETALLWAHQQGFAYGITGSVEEWHYRNGLDGEPAVGVTVQVVEIRSGRVVWSASGARGGWSRQTVSGTAHKLIASLLAPLEL